jgi:hypothetical protein
MSVAAGKAAEFCFGAGPAQSGTDFASKMPRAAAESRNRSFSAILYNYI